MKNKYKITILAVFVIVALVFIYFFLKTSTAPWEESSRFVLAVKTLPGIKTDNTLEIGIDNIELYKDDGTKKQITIITKRIQLSETNNNLNLILDTKIPVGKYSGIGFNIKSPEVKNAWQGDEPPEYVSLKNEHIVLKKSFYAEKDKSLSIILSFETTNALHESEEGEIYLPIIQMETRINPKIITDGNSVKITDGKIENIATFGMDWNGTMKYNFRARSKK